MASIRARQTEAIGRMLDLNRAPAGELGAGWQEPWKVLVYDRACQDVISPLLRVGDLRARGITLHLLIDAEREPVPDVPAVYFVMPTRENVAKIGADCARRLYDSYHVNFAAPVGAALLEELAALTLRAEAVSQVSQVVDQYLGFVSLEDELVDLNVRGCFRRLNDPAASDAAIEALLDEIAAGVLSVLATLGAVPIIKCAKGGAAQMVAERLAARLREALGGPHGGALFGEGHGNAGGFQRPVLVLAERSADMAVALQHPWSYRALCHDLLGMRLNRLSCTDSADDGAAGGAANGGRRASHTYTLEGGDAFWRAQAASPFPAVAEAVDAAIQAYRAEVDAINAASARPAPNGAAGAGCAADDLDASTRGLHAAMSALPELQEKKRLLDMHTNIATALLHKIRHGALDAFVGAEESVLASAGGGRPLAAAEKASLEQLITAGTAGSAEDRLRLLSFYYVLCSPPEEEVARLSAALRAQGADVRALGYLQQMAAFRSRVASQLAAQGGGRAGGAGGGGVMGSVLQLADKVGVGASTRSLTSTLAANVKALLPAKRETPLTRAVAAILEARPLPEADAHLTIDPRLSAQAQAADPSLVRRGPFRDALVFVVGGGSYLEYQNLQDYAAQSAAGGQGGRRLLYGCTELLTGAELLAQLAQLAPPT